MQCSIFRCRLVKRGREFNDIKEEMNVTKGCLSACSMMTGIIQANSQIRAIYYLPCCELVLQSSVRASLIPRTSYEAMIIEKLNTSANIFNGEIEWR
jgi:hypothetical protein